MNQRSLVAILIIVVIILAGTTVYLAMIKNVSQSDMPTPKVVQQSAQNNGIVYKNQEYGFQITLPKEWNNYKSKVNMDSDLGKATVYFYLPVSQKDYPSDMPGYGNIFAISVWDANSWNKQVALQADEGCPIGPGSRCLVDSKILFQNDKNVYDYSPNYATVGEIFVDTFTEPVAQNIIASFKVTK